MVERVRFTPPDNTRVDRSDEFGQACRALWNLMGFHCYYGKDCIRDEEGIHFSRCGAGCAELFEAHVASFRSEYVRIRTYKEERAAPSARLKAEVADQIEDGGERDAAD